MSRDLADNNLTAATAATMQPVLFVEMQFDSATVYIHSRIGTLTWGGHDWLGVGNLGGVTAAEEGSDLSRRSITYTLSGIPSDMISIVLNENYQGRAAKLYVGFLDVTTNALVATPDLLDTGRMDVAEINQGETFSVSITAESRFAAWSRPVVRRYNDPDQQSRFPGDKFFEFVEQTAEKILNWGQAG